jgi:hypothetical protein
MGATSKSNSTKRWIPHTPLKFDIICGSRISLKFRFSYNFCRLLIILFRKQFSHLIRIENIIKMKSDDIHYLTKLFSNENITICYIGELALNYYNVSRIVYVSRLNSLSLSSSNNYSRISRFACLKLIL